jgi:hypothetical protein
MFKDAIPRLACLTAHASNLLEMLPYRSLKSASLLPARGD